MPRGRKKGIPFSLAIRTTTVALQQTVLHKQDGLQTPQHNLEVNPPSFADTIQNYPHRGWSSYMQYLVKDETSHPCAANNMDSQF